ncbi:DMT family transporter [Sulfolobus acidocaldarius]|uniref:Archaeal membrane protein n=4 Tax=Sulfolobus acidocaldarius TaxID=2285 RepID=Q4J714_SULAC|nr:DMT family transporter [Sulfolobus acidocaldarius]AAY81431.1 Archaeal membrane protein [Sulfolobus acidocaldarius DSM 639]AGE72031.1 hypothetical protein SacN8_10405 [Sulfolobus acidocaldarius N8]AGE74348.1 hypothetical protein SacRon12I_10660 [Sulfolobus acidocaldarius Ron12/I]ALU29780.1 hypothetical protein ATY89_07395 [Sulfolobus acidocaldarius]ALU32518.1 hypothetical protein ATZ20_10415 [Sulfolobus acidocaldarius]
MKILKYLIPYIIVGSLQYYFAKDAITYSSPVVFNLLRYIISSAIFLSIRRRIVFNRDVFLLALYTTMSSLTWSLGLKYVSPSESAVLSYTMPLFSIPIAFLILSERPTVIETLGVGIGFLGVTLYGLPLVHGFSLLGATLTIINAVFWALFSVYYRKLRNEDPIVVNASQFSIGSVILALLLPIDHDVTINDSFIEGTAYTATLGGALSFFLWNMMVKIERVPRVTIFSFSIPILTTIIQVVVFNTSVFLIQIAGIAIIFIGIILSRIRDFVKVK